MALFYQNTNKINLFRQLLTEKHKINALFFQNNEKNVFLKIS